MFEQQWLPQLRLLGMGQINAGAGGQTGFGGGPAGGQVGFGVNFGGFPGGPGAVGPGGPGSAAFPAAAAAAVADGGDDVNHCWLCADGQIRLMTGKQMVDSGMDCMMLRPDDPRCRLSMAPALTYTMGRASKTGSRSRYGSWNVNVF